MEKNKELQIIIKGTGISLAIGLLGFISIFFIRLLAARYFGSEVYGIYELAMTLFSILVIFAGLGLQSGMSKFIPMYNVRKDYSKLKGYLMLIFIMCFLSSIGFSFLLFLFAKKISLYFNYPPLFTNIIQILSFFLVFKTMNNIVSNIFIANKLIFISEFGIKCLENLVLLVSLSILIFFQMSIISFIIFSGISTSIVFIFYVIMLHKSRILSLLKNKKQTYDLKTWIKYSLPLFFVGIFGYFLSWTDNLIIGKELHPKILGIYGISYSLGYYLMFLPTIFITILLPILSEMLEKKKNLKYTFNKVRNIVFSINLLVGMIPLFFPKLIISILYGQEYLQGYKTLSIICFFFIVTTFFYFYGAILLLEKDTSFIFFTQLTFAIINIFLSLILVRLYSIEGIAFASGLSLLLLNIVQMLRSRKYISFKIDIKMISKLFFCGLCGVLIAKWASMWMHTFFISKYLTFLFILITYGTICFVLCWITKCFAKEDIQLLMNLLKKNKS